MRHVALVCILLAACGDGDSAGPGFGGSGGTPPPVVPPPPPPPPTGCAANLAALYAALQQYETAFGSLPHETGGAFWIAIAAFVADPASYDCPVLAGSPPLGQTDYRGPASDANFYALDDPIAADGVANHASGGNVLLRNGTIVAAGASDPLWIVAAIKTAP